MSIWNRRALIELVEKEFIDSTVTCLLGELPYEDDWSSGKAWIEYKILYDPVSKRIKYNGERPNIFHDSIDHYVAASWYHVTVYPFRDIVTIWSERGSSDYAISPLLLELVTKGYVSNDAKIDVDLDTYKLRDLVAARKYPYLKEQRGQCDIIDIKDWLRDQSVDREVPGSRWVVWCQMHNCYLEARNLEEARWLADNPNEFCQECQCKRDGIEGL